MTESIKARENEFFTKKTDPLKLNLQFFADGGEGEGGDSGADDSGKGDSGKGEGDNPETLELTQDELNKKIEAEADRKLNSALEKKQKEWEKQQQKAIDDALAEKERLSKLSEKERKDEEMSKREKELADKEAEIARKVLRSEAVEDLQEKQLPSEFADFLLGEDAGKTLENINTFKKTFDEAVNAAVKEKLRQDTPPAGSGNVSNKQPSISELAKESRIIK